MFKLKFERDAMGVDSYSTDKSTYNSNEFNIELYTKGQRVRHIGVVINNAVNKSKYC